MKIKTTVFIDSAHKLELSYYSKCNELHGHTWRIDIEIDGEPINEGMIEDFSEIKTYFSEFDHCFLNDLPTMKGINPTAENLAKKFQSDIMRIFGLKKVKITVWETQYNCAVADGLE